jgi:tripartite ATP-independent transporter DctM subunit
MTGILLLTVFLLLTFAGVPIAYAMGLSTVAALLFLDVPTTVFFTRTIASINSAGLLAIPFFIIAGDILTAGGISGRLIAFANAAFGWIRGGLGVVSVASMMMFSGISGSAAADTVAVGGVMIPGMKKQGYDAGFAAALIAASASLGPIIPPSILLIIYGGITGVSVGALFVAGVVPGVILGVILMAIAWWLGRKQVADRGQFRLGLFLRTFVTAFLGLLLPVLLVVGILGGVFTATEAGVVVILLALVISMCIYRELPVRALGSILLRSTVLTAVLMLIVAMAAGFAWVLAYTRVPQTILTALTSLTTNPTLIMLIVIAFLLVVGMFVETVAAAIITVPILFPLGESLGYDPLHFALVIVMALMIGTITPPLGVLLYMCAAIGRVSVGRAIRASGPFVVVLIATVVLIALVPATVTWLPSLMLTQ